MSLFGEIVEPTSRTTWEDWDDDFAENDHNTSVPNWNTPIAASESNNTLFILEGRYLSNCTTQSQDMMVLVNYVDDVNLKLYKHKSLNDMYVCTVQNYDLLQSSEIVELLKPILNKSSNVISLLTKPLPEYQANTVVTNSCIVRKLCTTAAPNNSQFNFKKLEQPNIISGVSAGVTCLRELQNLPATVLVYYVEHTNEQIEEIDKQLEKLKIIDSSKRLHNSILSSNLYI